MFAIDPGKLFELFLLLAKDLNHRGAGNVLLQKSVDARNGGSNPAEGVANFDLEREGNQKQERKHGEDRQGEPEVEHKERDDDPRQRAQVPENRNHSRCEQLVQRVNVRCHPSHEAAHGIAVEESDIERFQMAEYLHPQVVHDLLAHEIHDHGLPVGQSEDGDQDPDIERRNTVQACQVMVLDVAVNGDLGQIRRKYGEDGGRDDQQQRQDCRAPVGSDVDEEAAHEPPVVRFSENLFFPRVHRHESQADASSSSSNCF